MFLGKLLIILLSLFIFISCGEENKSIPDNHLGELGYSCKEDSTCNDDLVCNKYKRCIKNNPACSPECEEWEECTDKICKTQANRCLDDNDCTLNKECKNHYCVDPNCTPDCTNKQCGGDGCGGSCGNCSDTQMCNTNTFQCVGSCTPDCNNKQCGDDGCGGSCGTCSDTQMCNTNTFQCVGSCTPDCNNKQCGDDGCGGSCGICSDSQICNTNTFQCVGSCTPDCNNKLCGDDGCSGSCGNCSDSQVCDTDTFRCVGNCTPSCDYKECGDDGCGGSCGTCSNTQSCSNFECVNNCTPDCSNKQCGDDGCGGSCGTCSNTQSCSSFQCVNNCTPDCNNKQCGDDGCGGSCGTCTNTQTCSSFQCINNPDVESPNQLIRDRHFRKGFKVRSSLQPGDIIGSIIPGFETGESIWTLGQWASFTDLNNFPKTVGSNGDVYWEDTYKKVTIGDADGVDLSLKVNAYNEYNGVYYQHGSSPGRTTWVHLLGEQTITDPYHQEGGCPALSELSALNFSVKAKLLYDNRNIGSGYDSTKHAAQYLMFFTIQNLNINSAGFGDFLWFGIMIHEDRGYTDLMIQGDDFSQKLIYNIGYDILNDYSNTAITDNQWHTLEEDFLPHILNALQEAWNRGYLSDSHNLSDYKIGGMNLGWEITGLNNAEMQIDDLSLIYTLKSGGVNECLNNTNNCDINATCYDTADSFICRCNIGYTGDGVSCTPGSTASEVRYDFNTDGNKEGWTTQNLNDLAAGGPSGGLWVMSVPGNDPLMLSPQLNIDASAYSKIMIKMANDHNPADSSILQVFWTRSDSTGFTESKSSLISVSNAGGWATYTLNVGSNAEWRGEITQIRVDPILSGDNHSVGIDYIIIAP